MALGNSRFGEWASGPLKLGGGDGSVTDIAPSGKNGGNYRSFFGSSPGGGGVAFDPSALDSSFNSQPGTGANLGASLSPGGGGGGGLRPWGSFGGNKGVWSGGPPPDTSNWPGWKNGQPDYNDPHWGGSGSIKTDDSGMGPPSPGGGYGMGGQGSAGLGFFDDGGEVGGDYSGGNTSQLDPMQIVKGALAYGRQKMGLPVVFHDDPEQQNGSMEQQGFDGGGPVLDPMDGSGGSDQGNVQQPINPQNTIQYLTGTGQLAPEIAEALEQQVDPEGTMDPAERKLMAIAQAPTQDAKFGLMQHYRTRYNAHSGAARAALDQGNLTAAAQHAMQAFHNVPTGMSVKFAPAGRGLAMKATKAGQQQGFDQGGAVDVTNPSVLLKQQEKGFEDGGGVLEEEGAPEDVLTDETPENSQPTVLTPEQVKAALDPGTYDEALDRGWGAWLDKVLSQGASNLNPVGSAEAGETRSPLFNPKQYFKDKGLFGMSNTPAEEVDNRFPTAKEEMPTPAAPQVPAPQVPHPPLPWTPNANRPPNRPPQRPVPQEEPAPQQPSVRRPQPKGPAYRNPNASQQQFEDLSPEARRRGIAPEENAPDDGKPWVPADIADEDNPDAKYLNRLNQLAHKLFPMGAGDAEKRQKYISHMYEKYQEEQSKERINERTVEGKKDVSRTTGETKAALQGQKEAAAMERALLSNNGKDRRNAVDNATRLRTNADNNRMRQQGQILMAQPDMLKDMQKLNSMLQADSAALGLSVPAAAQLAIEMARGGGGQTPAPGGQQQTPAPKVGNPNAAKLHEERPVRNPDTGKNEIWYFGNDGNWHKKH